MNSLARLCARACLVNTAPIDSKTYSECYNRWGGSFIVHPEVLQFFQDKHGIVVHYAGYFKDGRCIGAVACWGRYLAGDRSAFKRFRLEESVDFGYPIIYLPIHPSERCAILLKSRYLLRHQKDRIRGSIFAQFKAMSLLKRIPHELPTGKKEFQIKMRRFERLGGQIRDIQDFSSNEIVAMYEEAFVQRWGRKPHAIREMSGTLAILKKFLFGKVLWLEGAVLAIQINYRAETERTICIDYVNGGVAKSHPALSLGSVLSYVNGSDACGEAEGKGKQLLYSYGKANTQYKDQWCTRVPRGFTGLWVP